MINGKIVFFLMPCPFTGPKMLCADQNFLSQPKNLTAFSASSKNFVLAQKKYSIQISLIQIIFLSGTKKLDQPKTFWDL